MAWLGSTEASRPIRASACGSRGLSRGRTAEQEADADRVGDVAPDLLPLPLDDQRDGQRVDRREGRAAPVVEGALGLDLLRGLYAREDHRWLVGRSPGRSPRDQAK